MDPTPPPLLEILRGGAVVHTCPVGPSPTHLGRAPTNDVVLGDRAISAQHAAVWVDGSGVWVADYASRNGTFVNTERVRGAIRLAPGDVVWLGTAIELRVTGIPAFSPPPTGYAVEDVDARVSHPVRAARFHIGRAGDLLSDVEAVVVIHTNGEVWLGTDEGERPLEPGEVFVVGGRRLRVRPDDGWAGPTDMGPASFGYRLRVQLDTPAGPVATLTDPTRGATHRVETDNRVALLFVLVRQLLADRKRGAPPGEAGWCADEQVALGIWGRQAEIEANNLHVLIHRLRKDIERAGFDPWFLEKRRKAMRLRLDDVVID